MNIEKKRKISKILFKIGAALTTFWCIIIYCRYTSVVGEWSKRITYAVYAYDVPYFIIKNIVLVIGLLLMLSSFILSISLKYSKIYNAKNKIIYIKKSYMPNSKNKLFSLIPYIFIFIILMISFIFNVNLYNELKKEKNNNLELKEQLSKANESARIDSIRIENYSNAYQFLEDYVAIVPVKHNIYLTYHMWEYSIYNKEDFFIMSIDDAKKKYSNKYFESPMSHKDYEDLYGNRIEQFQNGN